MIAISPRITIRMGNTTMGTMIGIASSMLILLTLL
jgi:hypothetical protein